MKAKDLALRAVKVLAVPVVTYIFFLLLCLVTGNGRFGTADDMVVILRNTVYTGMIALAVSYNLTSGRFDFSIGSVLLLSTILGTMLALQLETGPVLLLLFSIGFGAIRGGIGGLLYVLLRLPPMIISLGVAMIYEAVAFLVSGGSGVKLLGRSDLLVWATGPHMYVLCVVVVAVLVVILGHTKFGIHTGALQTGQEISVSAGIDEKRNAVLCYVIAGGLLAIAGVINMSILGTSTPVMSLGSISYIQNAFLPMFIGVALARYTDRNIGVLVGALAQSIMISAFGRLGLSSSWQTILNGLVVIAFFAYSYNTEQLVEAKMFKEKLRRMDGGEEHSTPAK